jgi:hypothetical protein
MTNTLASCSGERINTYFQGLESSVGSASDH